MVRAWSKPSAGLNRSVIFPFLPSCLAVDGYTANQISSNVAFIVTISFSAILLHRRKENTPVLYFFAPA